jgi:polyphosphate kinase
MGQEKLYIEKELSWLSFNERVLQEAADKSNPLIERMRFLGIYSNNLDEFYKVRFAELKRRIIISEEQGSTATLAICWAKFRPACSRPIRSLTAYTTSCCWKWRVTRFS